MNKKVFPDTRFGRYQKKSKSLDYQTTKMTGSVYSFILYPWLVPTPFLAELWAKGVSGTEKNQNHSITKNLYV